MGNVFKDFIPDGEPTNAQGSGFVDFVPDPVPTIQKEEPVVETPVVTEIPVVEEPKKKKGK